MGLFGNTVRGNVSGGPCTCLFSLLSSAWAATSAVFMAAPTRSNSCLVNAMEKGGEVDRKATEGIRQTVKELKAQIATLEEEVAFYKGIMAPSSGTKPAGRTISPATSWK